jgi:hypothetical protein
MKKLTIEEFIKRSIDFHGNKYDYSLVNYINSYTDVKIICPIHDIFEQPPSDHFRFGCYYCSQKLNSDKSAKTKRLTTEKFIEKSIKIHNEKYDYSLSNYTLTDNDVEIICKIHGSFNQTPHHHLMGCGCPNCYDNIKIKDKKLYILHDEEYNLYKIGYSKNVNHRRNQIELSINKKLNIVKIYENCAILEKKLHKLYNKNRIQHPIKHCGYNEWFKINDNVLEDIDIFIKNYKPL